MNVTPQDSLTDSDEEGSSILSTEVITSPHNIKSYSSFILEDKSITLINPLLLHCREHYFDKISDSAQM